MTTPPPEALGARITRQVGRMRLVPNDITLADAARDRRDWAEAARLYAQVLARGRERADLLVQLGHCLKEAGRHGASFDAYGRALRRAPQAAEPHLQLGHLLKVSGNAAAARVLYARAATLGSADAKAECDGAADPGRWPMPHPQRGMTVRPLQLAACRLARAESESRPAGLLDDAARLLLGADQPRAARACLAMAALLQGFGDPAADERLALHASAPGAAWPSLPATVRPLADGRALQRALVRASLADGLPVSASLAAMDTLFPQATALQAGLPALTEQDGDEDLAALLIDLQATLGAAAAGTMPGPVPASLADAVRQRAAMAPRLCFPADADATAEGPDDPAPLLRTAWRVLHNLARSLCAGLVPLLGAEGDGLGPRVLGVLARGIAGGAPLYLPAAATAPILPDLDPDQIEDIVATLLPEAATEAERIAHAERVAFVLTRALGQAEALSVAARMSERGWTQAACLTIADRFGGGGLPQDRDGILDVSRVLKHAGVWRAAAALLDQLVAAYPEDDDLLAELAIVQKTCGEFQAAAASLDRLIARRRHDEFAERELLAILPEILPPEALAAWVSAQPHRAPLAMQRLLYRLQAAPPAAIADPALSALPPGMLLELRDRALPVPGERIEVLQLGWLRSADGTLPRLAGIAAIRVRVVSRTPIVALRVRIAGRSLARLPAQPGARPPGTPPGWHVSIFNAWIDAGAAPPGRQELQLYAEEVGSGYRTLETEVEIGGPVPEPGASDAIVAIAGPSGGDIADAVNALPSVVRPARRALAGAPPVIRNVLLLRADQLGDVVASIPAMLRLREMLPEARFHGLATPATRDLLTELGIFDVVGTVALAYDHRTKRRHLAVAEARRLREQLAAWEIDLAVDLSPGTDTRPLLRLAGAACTAGFKPREFPWLTFAVDTVSRDAVNGRECMSHQAMVSGFVEALGVALGRGRTPAPVAAAAPGGLAAASARAALGIPAEARLVVAHAGARLDFKRWPATHFARLALLATEALPDLHVLLMADAPLEAAATAPLTAAPRVHLVDGHLPFPAFRALLGSCAAFIGNDTGPKHLAAHLGAPVISLHMGQVNWSEWGQEGEGEIISRRVPCCGCGIEDLADCGAALACLVHIRPEEVLAVLLRRLGAAAPSGRMAQAAAD